MDLQNTKSIWLYVFDTCTTIMCLLDPSVSVTSTNISISGHSNLSGSEKTFTWQILHSQQLEDRTGLSPYTCIASTCNSPSALCNSGKINQHVSLWVMWALLPHPIFFIFYNFIYNDIHWSTKEQKLKIQLLFKCNTITYNEAKQNKNWKFSYYSNADMKK